MADSDLGHVPDADRHAVVAVITIVADLLDGAGAADALDEARLARPDDVAAADVLVVLLEGPDDVVERELVLGELRRVGPDLELLREAAPGVDLGDPGHPAQPRPDHPILERPQLGQVVRTLAREEIVIDLAEAGGDRPHRRPLDALGELGLAQALVDLLPGEVDVGPVLEDGDDLREAELRDGADLLEPFKPPRACSTGKVICRSTSSGDSSGATVLIWTCTGVVSGKASSGRRTAGPDAEDDEDAREQEHDEAVLEAEFDEGIEHREGLPRGRSVSRSNRPRWRPS